MIPRKKQIAFWVTAILTVCLYLYGRYRMHGLEEKMDTISFVKTGEGSFIIPRNDEKMSGVFWAELENRYVEGMALGKSVETTVIALHGRSDILFPNMPVIDEDCRKSCLISESLAYELFGGTDVKGLEISYQGNVYQVSGIFRRDEKLFLYEPSLHEQIPYNRFSVKEGSPKAINILEQELQMRYGSGRVLDYTMPRFLFEVCFLTDIEFPLDMIPDKWSNFEFWTQRIEEKKEASDFLSRVQKTTADMDVREDIIFMKRLAGVLFVLVIILISTGKSAGLKGNVTKR